MIDGHAAFDRRDRTPIQPAVGGDQLEQLAVALDGRMNLVEQLEKTQRLACSQLRDRPLLALSNPCLEISQTLLVIVEANVERRAVRRRDIASRREIRRLGGIVPVRQQPVADVEWRRGTRHRRRTRDSQQTVILDLRAILGARTIDLHARMIRRIGQSNRPGMLAHMSNWRKPQLVGFLQEQVELPQFVPDVLDHPDRIRRRGRTGF